MIANVFRLLVITTGLVLLWQAVVWVAAPPPFILPGPLATATALVDRFDLLMRNAAVTLAEILLGLLFGTLLGVAGALAVIAFAPARRWLLPLLIASQAVPVFAIAPLLVLWLGDGMASKVAMATLIIFFPVTASFLDGLRRTEGNWLDLAQTMAGSGTAARLATMRHIRIPAALPALASGLRVAAAVAPIGAVVGEWVGSGAGLGYLMLQANARMQVDLMFAALLILALITLALFYAVDAASRALIPWQDDSLPAPKE
jgi:putative hydroxymethylpyrimidine transport system permease protein